MLRVDLGKQKKNYILNNNRTKELHGSMDTLLQHFNQFDI